MVGLGWRRLIAAALLTSLVLVAGSCGIKRPPVPPKARPVQTFSALTCELDGTGVILSWTLAVDLSDQQANTATFEVYRSRSTLREPACDGCPQVFEKAATIPYVPTDDRRFSTRLELESGYRYVVKVRLNSDGRPGPESETVQFELPDEQAE